MIHGHKKTLMLISLLRIDLLNNTLHWLQILLNVAKMLQVPIARVVSQGEFHMRVWVWWGSCWFFEET